MARIKLNKSEYRHQRGMLKRYQRYLPTLQLKKQQLQAEERRTGNERDLLVHERDRFLQHLAEWIAVFGEAVPLSDWLQITKLEIGEQHIAGVKVPELTQLTFSEQVPHRAETPLWIDAGLEALRKHLELDLRLRVLEMQHALLLAELRTTNQRINLFEKVKIPECRENIRVIRIALGDEQVAGVARAKLAKRRSPVEQAG